MFVSSYNIGESLNRKTWGKCMCVCGRTRNPNPPGRGSKLSSKRHGINNFCINNFLSSHVTRILDSPNAEAQTAAAPCPRRGGRGRRPPLRRARQETPVTSSNKHHAQRCSRCCTVPAGSKHVVDTSHDFFGTYSRGRRPRLHRARSPSHTPHHQISPAAGGREEKFGAL